MSIAKISMAASLLMTAMLSISAYAADQYTDRGRVLSVKPQTERVNMPRQVCHTEYRQAQPQPNRGAISGGSVLGGIAGGLLGSTIGKGSGRVAAAAVGAGIGAITGDRLSNRNRNRARTRSVPVESCYETDDWKTVNTGYLVDYEYNGRQYSTITTTRPDKYIDVSVSVTPISHDVISSNEYWSQDADYPRRGKRNRYYGY